MSSQEAKAKKPSGVEGEGGGESRKEAGKAKRSKLLKLGKHKEAGAVADGTPIVPATENGSVLQSGIRAHPTSKLHTSVYYSFKFFINS